MSCSTRRTDDIRGLHLHPKDVPGAIVSIDAAREPADWPWAGPVWRQHVDTSRVSSICGMTVSVDDPTAVAMVWAAVLDVPVSDDAIALDDAVVRFRGPEDDGRTGITRIELTAAPPAPEVISHELLGVTVSLV